MDFVRAQPKGIASPCCDSNGCTKPSTKYSCGAGQALQLCVVNGAAAECVDPASSAICSGNYTAAVVGPSGSGPASDNGPSDPTASSSGHSGLSQPRIATIATVTSVLTCVTGVVGLIVAVKKGWCGKRRSGWAKGE
jgi:hypothetical protein